MRFGEKVYNTLNLVQGRNFWVLLNKDPPRALEEDPFFLAKSCLETIAIDRWQATRCGPIDGALSDTVYDHLDLMEKGPFCTFSDQNDGCVGRLVPSTND